jgi:hypothetical protein
MDDLELFDPEFVNIPKLAEKIAEYLEIEGENASDESTGITLFELLFNKRLSDKVRYFFRYEDYENIGKELRSAYEITVELEEEQKAEQEQHRKALLKEFIRVPELPEKKFPGGTEYLRVKKQWEVKQMCSDLSKSNKLSDLKQIANDLDLIYPADISKKDLCKILISYYDKTEQHN